MCFNKRTLQVVTKIIGLTIGIVGLIGASLFWYKYGFHIDDPVIILRQFICVFGAFVGIIMTYLTGIDMKLDKILEKS